MNLEQAYAIIRSDVHEPAEIGDFRIEVDVREYLMDFRCFQCIGMTEGISGECNVPEYGEYEVGGIHKTTEEVTPFLSGHIKWDGCANVTFDEQEEAALHFCGRKGTEVIGKLFDRLYEIAEKSIPRWGG